MAFTSKMTWPHANKCIGTSVLLVSLLITSSVNAATGLTGTSDPSQLGQSQHLVMMIVYATVALTFSFLCSVAEAVVLSVSPSYIATLKKEGKKGASLLQRIKANIDRSLAAILTLNTIAHTVGAGGAGAEAAAYFGDQYVGVAMAILTLLILFLSEIIPKTVGAVYWRKLALLTARFVQLLIWLLYPLILVSEQLTQLLTRGKKIHGFNREEFAALADIGAAGGHLDPKEFRILKNLFRFPVLCAEDIMTPRTVVFTLQQDLSVHEVMEKHKEISVTRIPIYGENRDDISGFVLKTDMLLNESQGKSKAKLRDLRRDIRAVQESTPLSQVLEELLDNRAHILLVVDQYGGTSGLVTLEDVVETLIGFEIVDESDKIDDMRKLARQRWEERMDRIGIDVRDSEKQLPES
jgi:CBS domain containing-hemolysin-like protein